MTRKTNFFEGWSLRKFNNLGQVRGMVLKLYTSMEKKLKLNVTKFYGLIFTFVEVTRKNPFCPPPPILEMVKVKMFLSQNQRRSNGLDLHWPNHMEQNR